MKILFIADSDSPHTLKWIKGINKAGYKTAIFSIHSINRSLYKDHSHIELFSANLSRKYQSLDEKSLSKLIYIISLIKIRQVIKKFQPNIVHAHYASSYGLLACLSGFKPVILSYWGSDALIFPYRSFIHKCIIKYVSRNVDVILATSESLKSAIKNFTNHSIHVIPFGVNIREFTPSKQSTKNDDQVIIGVIKSLEENYGIKYLIEAFRLLKNDLPDLDLRLLIIGKGGQRKVLENLVSRLNLSQFVEFSGYVDHSEIYLYHQKIDVAVIPSLSESFGVSAVESMACAKPVVASNIGGLPEIIDDGRTGFLVEPRSPVSLYRALRVLIVDKQLRVKFGTAGREKVVESFDWEKSLQSMLKIYQNLNLYR